MLRRLNSLDSSQITGLDVCANRQRKLSEADGARIRVIRRAQDLKRLNHGVGHVHGPVVRSVGSKAEIDLHKRSQVASEPAWLEGHRAARGWPVCAVLGGAYAAAFSEQNKTCQPGQMLLDFDTKNSRFFFTYMDIPIAFRRDTSRL